jgi:hypothetical protein
MSLLCRQADPHTFLLHYHIINICLDISPDLSFQDDLNVPLICRSPILYTKCHLSITVDFKWSDERWFLFVVYGEADLMIDRIGIQKRHHFIKCSGINNLTNTT